jgi:hypothetical protein
VTLRIVGAGLGRTGTLSQKAAIEELLGGRCYHMVEVFGRPDDIPTWQAAAEGSPPDWSAFFADFEATVDWPSAGFWEPIADTFPDALVLLSTRADSETWWRSASRTIFDTSAPMPPEMDAHRAMWHAVAGNTFTADWSDEHAAREAYDRHNAHVRSTVDPARLVEWQPGDGWEPLCTALGLPVPDEPFPKTNSTDEFRAMRGLGT